MKHIIISVFTIVFILLSTISSPALGAKYSPPFDLPELTGNMRQDFINITYSQLGYEEASDNSTIFGAWAGDPYQKWCSEFAAWCAEKAEIPPTIFPKKKSCAGYLEFFAPIDLYYHIKEGVNPGISNFTKDYTEIKTKSVYDLNPGDIILQETNNNYTDGPDHTAIFLENTKDGVKTISGNLSNKVKIKVINAKDIHGICTPDFERKKPAVNINLISSEWAKTEIMAAYEKRLLPERMIDDNLKKEIKRAEFAALAVNLYSRISGKIADAGNNPFDDTKGNSYETDIIKAYNLGIVSGTGENKFNPDGKITREQAATMLMRTADVLGADTSHNVYIESGVSSWAKKGVGFVIENNIMKGTDSGFEPLGKYTKEQAIVTFIRMYNHLKE